MSGTPFHIAPEKLAERLGVTPRTIARWRVTGAGPRLIRVGPRRVVYAATGVLLWEDARTYVSRAAEAISAPIAD